MNCNKCGTPILPGENTCRFCGAIDDFSVRVPAEPKKEIIGFDIYDDIQIVDFTLGEDEVSINPTPESKEPVVIIDDVIDFPKEEAPAVTEQKEIVEPVSSVVEQPSTPIVNAIIEEPATARIPVEEVKKIIEEESANMNEIIDEPVAENVVETTAEESTDTMNDAPIEEPKTENEIITDDKINEEEIKETKISKNDDKKTHKKSGIISIVLTMLLIASIILNCFLLMGRATNVEITDVGVSKTSLATVFDNYEMRFPNNWDTNSSYDSYLLVYDSTKSWGASISFATDIDYSLVKENVNEITKKLGLNNYLFTSDYSKTVNSKELYVFKGKYYSAATYVIITKVDENTVAVADLKFTGEVEEDVLEGIFNSLTSITSKDMSSLLENNFEFRDIRDLIGEALPNNEE